MVAQGRPCHRQCSGFTLGEIREQVDSEIIVDLDWFYKTHPKEPPAIDVQDPPAPDNRESYDETACNCVDSEDGAHFDPWHDVCIDEMLTNNFMNEHAALFRWRENQDVIKQKYAFLLPRKVHAFVLHTRAWSALDINDISNVKMNSRGFDDLVLPAEHKRIVEAVVRMHSAGAKPVEGIETSDESREAADLVRGKGKGIIMLLHGLPGTGKTSTAETIAALTGRPLFALTCSDIGSDAESVQQNLEENFRMAHRWGCVMLLDEADVFLQQRNRHDMQRNAIVSVFLRILEYYSGILFLTTNKVGTFDEAFKSRIHIALYYKQLDMAQSLQIWKNNFKRVKASRAAMDVDVKKLMAWAKEEWVSSKKAAKEAGKPYRPWNGRQIHNACQTAAALAEFRSLDADKKAVSRVILSTDDLTAVANATKAFDKYLLVTHGKDDYGRAQELKDRNDDAFMAPQTVVRKKVRKPEPVSEDEDEDVDLDDSDVDVDDL